MTTAWYFGFFDQLSNLPVLYVAEADSEGEACLQAMREAERAKSWMYVAHRAAISGASFLKIDPAVQEVIAELEKARRGHLEKVENHWIEQNRRWHRALVRWSGLPVAEASTMHETSRAADDFATIGAKLRELTAVPELRRTGSGAPNDHCAHCPTSSDEKCGLNCGDEGRKVGVVE